MVHIFYKPQGVSIDFTLAIIGVIFILLGHLFKLFIKIVKIQVIKLQEKHKKIIQLQKKAREKRIEARKAAEKITTNSEKKVLPKLILIITPVITKIKNSNNDNDLTFKEYEHWRSLINRELVSNMKLTNPLQSGYYRNNLFCVYKNFEIIDEFIGKLKPTLESIKTEYKLNRINTEFAYVFSGIVDMNYFEKELDCMDTILSLNFTKDIIATSRFKIYYDNKNPQKYVLKLKGEYNLSKNLMVSNNQLLYAIKEKVKKQEKKL